MTGVSNLNIVVQQAGNAAEAHQVKQQSPEYTQTVAAQEQAARNSEMKQQVQEGEESGKPYLDREDPREKKRGGQASGQGKKQKKKGEKPPESRGNLLDTVV